MIYAILAYFAGYWMSFWLSKKERDKTDKLLKEAGDRYLILAEELHDARQENERLKK